jgi:RNA polymerase sigma-70 factor, ECF subfamily
MWRIHPLWVQPFTGPLPRSRTRSSCLPFRRARMRPSTTSTSGHRARVTAICRRMLGNRSDAEEAAQETFLKAFEALPRFNGRFQVGPWLARIATNACIDLLRSRGRAHLVALPKDGDELTIEEGPESLIAGRDLRVRRAIREIQPTHARALVMRNLEGLSHREIGERMAIAPAQVKAQLHRARRSLRRAWDKAQGWAVAPAIGMRVAFSRGSENAHHASAHLAGEAGGAASVIGGKVGVMIVAATLSGLPPSDSRYEPAPRESPAAGGEVEVKRKLHAPRAQARAVRPSAGESSTETPETSGGDLTTKQRKAVTAAAPPPSRKTRVASRHRAIVPSPWGRPRPPWPWTRPARSSATSLAPELSLPD